MILQLAIQHAGKKRKCMYVSPETICEDTGFGKKQCQTEMNDALQKGLIKKRGRLVALVHPFKKNVTTSLPGKWIYHSNQDNVLPQQKHIQECYLHNIPHCIVGKSMFIDFKKRNAYVHGTVFKISWIPDGPFDLDSVTTFIRMNAPTPRLIILQKANQEIPDSTTSRLLFHGTKTLANAKSILKNGFDATLRDRQAFGKGEYFSSEFWGARMYGAFVVVTEVFDSIQIRNNTFLSAVTKNQYPRAILVYK